MPQFHIPFLLPKLVDNGIVQYPSRLINIRHSTSQQKRLRESHRHGKRQVCRLSTSGVPPGPSMDKFRRRIRPRHHANGNPLQIHGTSNHGGCLDILRSRGLTHELYPADDPTTESVLHISHHSRRDPRICGSDRPNRKLFAVRVSDQYTLLDGPLVRQGELFGALLQTLPRAAMVSPRMVCPRRVYAPCVCRMLDYACHFVPSYYEFLQV
jgi:hypothetical protein